MPDVTATQFRELCGQFATGVAVVTARASDGSPAGMTANSFASVSLVPPLISVNIDESADMHRVLAEADALVVNILSEGQEAVSRRFAEPHDRKFDGVAHADDDRGIPVLAGTLATLSCTIEARVPAGDHTIIIARVIGGSTRQGSPLLYHRGEYLPPGIALTRLAGSAIGTELLDDPTADREAVRLSLRNIARANGYFGGWRAVRTGLARLLQHGTAPALTLLDVGTGAGDLLHRARSWSARRGVALRMIGLDQHPAAAQLAHESGIPAVIGCGATLPLADRSVDLVMLSQVAHHLAPESLAAMARELTRVSRIGVVLADLRPSWIAGAAYRLTGPLLGFDHFTVVDGITSLERGFTPARLERELGAAGVTPWIATQLGVRIVAAWRADGSAA